MITCFPQNMGICAISNGVLNHKEQEKEDISIQCRNMRLTSDPCHNMPLTSDPCHNMPLTSDQSTSAGIPCGLSDVNSVSSIQRAISLPQGDIKKLPYDMQDGYKPEIEQPTDSQVYYQINNVLFNAHVERCKRTHEDESSY